MSDKKKILITSTFPNSMNRNNSILRYMANGFRELDLDNEISETSIEIAAKLICEKTPEIVLAIGSLVPDSMDYWTLRRACDTVGAVLAFWLHDDPYEFDYNYKIMDLADIVFTCDRSTLYHYDHPKVHHLPMAADRHTHYRPLRPLDERSLHFFFCGYAYPNRIDVVSKAWRIFAQTRTLICGEEWPEWLPFAKNTRINNGKIADYYSDSYFVLNLGREFNIANARYDLPASTPGPRTFECALAGAAQLFFANGLEIADYFDSSSEIILFDDVYDIADWAEKIKSSPSSIEAIAAAAQQRALAEHCYSNRAATVLSTIATSK